MNLTKVHKVLDFKQSGWLEGYIGMNSGRRAAAKKEFERDFFKLMNNAIYGKTCENQKDRTDIHLVTDVKKFQKELNKPNLLNYKIFSESLAAIELRKPRVLIDKPF